MKKNAYGLGVFGFGMVSAGQLAPVLIGDELLSNWQFAGLTVTVFLMLFCAYKTFGMRAAEGNTPS